jgi:protein O-GlcNAc transferase
MNVSDTISREQLEQFLQQALAEQQQGNLEAANKLYQQVVRFDPGNIAALNNLSIVLRKLNKLEQAIEVCKHLIKVKPNFVNAYDRIGKIYVELKRYDEAIDFYRRALSIEKKPSILFSISIPYYFNHNYREAEKALKQYLKISPDNAAAHMNMALVYFDTNRADEAEFHARETVRLDSDSIDGNYNLGMILSAQGKSEEAIRALRKVIELNQNHQMATSVLLREMQAACDWAGVEKLKQEAACKPFADLMLNDNAAENLNCSSAHAADIEKKANIAGLVFDFSGRENKEQLTIGYLSFDYREHPLAHLTQQLFPLSNKQRYKIIAYATSSSDGSEIRKQYERNSSKFRDISSLSDKEAAKKIYADGVDILFDLTGYTAGSRLGIAALHPAPINVNMWGFPGTIGGNIMDYTIIDEVAVPKDQQQNYAEKLVYLPNTLQIAHNKEAISEREFTKAEVGLPEDAVVFCSFNPTYKFEPVMFDIWMSILKQVSGSVLWLRKPNEIAQKNLITEAEKRGIAGDRLVFAERIEDRADYFKRIQLADIGLDTRLYNGGSTTIDTLWAGVPVVTLLGRHYASRMSAGIINGADMAEFITHDLEEYEEMAISYASDKNKLAEAKKKLWQNRRSCALFDSSRFVGNLEKAIEQIWQNYISGNKPKMIEVVENG